ncbi:MAG: cell division protein FtsA [Clostridiaceae bacterium]|nr:cell division protein FtsA [Clostridiaceae bacterium]
MVLPDKKTLDLMPDDHIFALDIGTRTVIGLVGVQKDEHFIVHEAEIISHQSRAMVDGQIHDIEKVVHSVKTVKESLEKKLGFKLHKAAIAAAGRVLKTSRVTVSREIEEGQEIDQQLISALEMEGIQKAQLNIDTYEAGENEQFYCVGYSVVNYYLNDFAITSLIGHKGKKAGVEILATFLPQTVVDSLYTVIQRAGMEVEHITLEPIAALNLAIPPDLRLLNLALIDVGAGTSDIAITKSGTIVAYSMVPMAGDEITEAIAQNYLVDFNTAEKIKISISSENKPVTFCDILDNEITVTPEEVNSVISPIVEKLAGTIVEKIREYNGGKSPNAIFLIGGGSLSGNLCKEIANLSGLPESRVAVRDRKMAKSVIIDEDTLKGPEGITPLGILVTSAMANSKDFFYVTVNGEKVRIFNSRKMNVSDALILAGIKPEELLCKSGRTLRFYVNGEERSVRGGFGTPAKIYVNNVVSRLNNAISPGDEIKVIPAEDGRDGSINACELIEGIEPVRFTYNGNTRDIYPRILINGEEVLPDTPVQNNDRIEIIKEYSVKQIQELFEIDSEVYEFTLNGLPADENTFVGPGDCLEGKLRNVKDSAGKNEENFIGKLSGAIENSISPNVEIYSDNSPESGVSDNEHDFKEMSFADNRVEALDESAATGISDIKSLLDEVGQKLAARDGITVKVNGKLITLPPKPTGYIFIDIFNHIDFDLTSPKGVVQLRLNGREAGFTDAIGSGDVIDIYWEE